jgi:plastocyanin
MLRIVTLTSSLLLSAAALIACGGTDEAPPSAAPASSNGQSSTTAMPSQPSPTSPGAPQAEGGQIVISNMMFTVPPTVRPGQQLTIVNKDEPNHTVTADDNVFDIRVSGGGGIEAFTAPTTPGTYPFHCKYHTNMHGLLIVQ